MARQRVLITGVASDAGRLLVQRLQAAASSPLIVVCSRQSPAATLDYLEIAPASRAAGDVVAVEANPAEEGGEAAFAEALAGLPNGGAEFDAVVNLIGAWFARPGRDDPRQIVLGSATTIAKSVKPRGPAFRPTRFVLTSSLALYGDRPGEILTEASPLKPDLRTQLGHWGVEVEEVMLGLHKAQVCDLVTLRCPHIYGTPKEKTIDRYRDGTMIIMGTGKNILQHIHYHDYVNALALASGVLASERCPPGTYNLVDDTTETYAEYCKFITDWCRHPASRPVSLEECISSGCLKNLLGAMFGVEAVVREICIPIAFSQQFDNSKVKKGLGIVLKYPTFRHGLANLMLAMDWQAAGWKEGNVFHDAQVAAAANVDGGYSNPQQPVATSKKPEPQAENKYTNLAIGGGVCLLLLMAATRSRSSP